MKTVLIIILLVFTELLFNYKAKFSVSTNSTPENTTKPSKDFFNLKDATVCSDDNTSANGNLETFVSIWFDVSGSSKSIVPDLRYDQLTPIIEVFKELDAATLCLGSAGAKTRDEMAFLSFNSIQNESVPRKTYGETPLEYRKRIKSFQKRKKRKVRKSSLDDKLVQFEYEAQRILSTPKNQHKSLLCEALNLNKRQLEQSNIGPSTSKFILFLSDMHSNGAESCPFDLGDAHLIIVNRLPTAHNLLFHKNTHHFASIEEAIDYITSNI